MHLLIFVVQIIVRQKIRVTQVRGRVMSSCGVGSSSMSISIGSDVGVEVIVHGTSSICVVGMVGTGRITVDDIVGDVISSGDMRVVVRVEDINTTSMDPFIREWVIQLFRRMIDIVLDVAIVSISVCSFARRLH